jgi:hypothetical protein
MRRSTNAFMIVPSLSLELNLHRSRDNASVRHGKIHPTSVNKSGYVHPRRKTTAEPAMRITKSQTKLNAIRSERSNFHLRNIYIAAPRQVHQLTRPHHTHRSREPSYFTRQLAFFCLALRPDAIGIGKCLWNSSACRNAHNKKDQANHQEQEEQQFGYPCRSSSNTCESKKRRHQCDYKKN